MKREGFHHHRPAWQPSAAQRRILDALVDGLTNAEIAVRLRMSPETAKWHVSELLAETRLDNRQALAAWWRADRASRERRRVAAPLAGLVRLAPLLAAVVVGAIAVRLLLLPSTDKPAPSATGTLTEQAAAPETSPALPAGFEPDAWVLDLEQGTASPLPVSIWAAQWYEPGKTLLAKAGKLQVIVDLQGNAIDSFGQDHQGGFIGVQTGAAGGEGAFVWRWREGSLSYYDAASDREELRLTLALPPERRRIDLQLSPDRTKLAYTQISGDETALFVADIDGGNAVKVLSRPSEDEVWLDSWSPDSRRLLVRAGTRSDCRPNGELDVCTLVNPSTMALDLSGDVVWQRDGGLWQAHWAGPDRILVEDNTLAVQILASMGLADVCATPERPPGGLPSCLYTVQPGETLESIADRFGIEPDGQMFQVTLSGTLPLVGESPQVSPGDILSIPAPLEGSLIDLLTGKATPLDLDVRGLICISPDGATGIFQSLTIEPRSNKVTARTTAIDLATGQTIVATPVAHGLITCTDRSWTPDGSMVVLSSWGK
jgi:DNA-binding CsgD family transcriptional regulator